MKLFEGSNPININYLAQNLLPFYFLKIDFKFFLLIFFKNFNNFPTLSLNSYIFLL